MDDRRPVPTADLSHHHRSAELSIDGSPPFRSSRPVEPGRPAWTRQVPFFLRSAWGGLGVWLGAVTVVGVSAFILSLALADVVGDSRSADPALNDDGALGVDIGGGIGAPSDDQRASRARTTGEVSDDGAWAGPATNEPGRSNGPAGGVDLDLSSRPGEDRSTGSVASTPGVVASPGSAVDPTQSTEPAAGGAGATAGEASSPTTRADPAMSFPGGEPPTETTATTSPVTAGAAHDDWPGSVPPGSTSVPELGTLPPLVTSPPSVSLPPPGPPTSGVRPTTPARPSVPAAPPTTRRPVPADTRPSPGAGRGHGRGPNRESGGRAVGRPQ